MTHDRVRSDYVVFMPCACCNNGVLHSVHVLKTLHLCLVAIVGNFENALIFRILAAFGAVFCIERLQCVVETFLACFYAFLIFEPK